MKDMDGKVALVTGAGSGIGRATALLFADNGARVVVSDLVADTGSETVELIRSAGGEALFVQTDISSASDVESLMIMTVENYGRLNFAVNTAGMEAAPRPTADCLEDDFVRTIDVNLKGTWLCMKHEIQQMLKSGSGSIVNMSSIAGLVGVPFMSAYVAAKHGIIGLTKTAALEYGTAGIRVNVVCPSAVRTPMMEQILVSMPELEKDMDANHPIGRIGQPEEIAKTIVWLCSDAASFVTGHSMAIDGGFLAK